MKNKFFFVISIIISINSSCLFSQSLKDMYEIGKKAFYSEDFEQSQNLFSQILNMNSDNYETHFYKGLIYNIYFDYDKALQELSKAIEIQPSAEAYFNRATIYDRLKKYSDGIKDYTKAIKKNPKLVDAYFNRATDYQEIQEYEKAIMDYGKVVKLNPKDDIAYYNKGLLHKKLKQFDEAIIDFERAIKIDKIWERELRPKIEEMQKNQ